MLHMPLILVGEINHVTLSPSDLMGHFSFFISLLFPFKLEEILLLFVLGLAASICFLTNDGVLEIEDEVISN